MSGYEIFLLIVVLIFGLGTIFNLFTFFIILIAGGKAQFYLWPPIITIIATVVLLNSMGTI